MKFGFLHDAVAYGLAGLGLFSLSLGSELGLPVVALLFIGYLSSFWLGPKLCEHRHYTAIWNGVMVTLLALQVIRGATGAALLPLGLEFAAALQIAKLFHRRGARDYLHIQTLAFLHLVAATVLSSGLDYAFVFVGFVVVAPWMLALSHLRSEIEAHYGPDTEPSEPGETKAETTVAESQTNERVERVLQSRRIAGPRFLAGTAGLSVPLFAITAAFFLLFPRVGLGFLNFGAGEGRQVAGFGSDVSLGGFGVIRDDPTVVLRVTPEAGSRGSESFRLRGTSFDRYRGARWTRSPAVSQTVHALFNYYDLTRTPVEEADRELSIVLDPLDEPVVFLPVGTIGVTVDPRISGGLELERQLIEAPGLDIRYGDADGLELHYTAHVDEDQAAIVDMLRDDEREGYLQLESTPAIERIAAAAAAHAGEGSDEVKARRLESWLRDSGEFEYSLRMPEVGDRDPLEVFLLDARSGHCEYFSTALAVMLRTQGVPTRNVTGFVGGLYNPYGGYYAIRQGDAHSWVEAHFDGAWHTLDPTPAARDAIGPQGDGWLVDLRGFLDALRIRWSRDVVGYDLRRQVDGLREVLAWFRSMRGGDPGERVDPSQPQARSSSSRGIGWLVPVVLVLLTLVGIVAWIRRRRRDRMVLPLRERQARSLYEELERAMARLGIPRRPQATPREYAALVRDTREEAAELVDEVTKVFESIRFGGVDVSADRVNALRARIKDEL